MNRYQVIGVNDDVDTCDCCGKTGLKKVVWIEDTETGVVQHFGTTCALSPAKGFGVDAEVKLAVSRYADELIFVARLTHSKYRKAGGKYTPTSNTTWETADRALWDNIYSEILIAVRANNAVLAAMGT
jgi:hypothetical protein